MAEKYLLKGGHSINQWYLLVKGENMEKIRRSG